MADEYISVIKYLVMENHENEPTGFNENEKRNESTINQSDERLTREGVDDANNDLAGVAAGSVSDKETQNPNPDDINGGKGFLGDFATVQHDDEAKLDDDEHSKHVFT